MDESAAPELDLGRSAVPPPGVIAAGDTSLTVLVAGFEGALGAALRLIAQNADLRVVGNEGEVDVARLITKHRPAVALVNHDAISGAPALRKLVVARSGTATVIAVMRLSRERDERLLAAGARVVVPITVGTSELRAALRLAALGLVGSPWHGRGVTDDSFGSLTARETQVFELLARRRSTREIAAALHVTAATVNTHRRHIYDKLGVHRQGELASRAAELLGRPETSGREQP